MKKDDEVITEEEARQAVAGEERHMWVSKNVHLDGFVLHTSESNAVAYLKQLMKAAKRTGRSDEPVSRLVKARRGGVVTQLTREGKHLLYLCKNYGHDCYIWQGREECFRYEHHRFHPLLAVVMKAVGEVHEQVNDASSYGDHGRLHRLLTDLAETIRSSLRSPQVQQAVKNYRRNADQKLRRALNYLLSLFGGHSRLLVLRVDLYVRNEFKTWSYSEEADEAFDKFVKALCEDRIVPDVLGWMSAREDGVERGQHYHVLVALDGHKHRAGANLTRMLGEYWVNECVGSTLVGSYFNCFSLAKKYKHLGIGLIHCTDARKLLGLFHATRYLCKDEVQLIATGKRARNFRRGVEVKQTPRTGAPRHGGDDLSLARRMLLGQMGAVEGEQGV